MSEVQCDRCLKFFKNKAGLSAHGRRLTPCAPAASAESASEGAPPPAQPEQSFARLKNLKGFLGRPPAAQKRGAAAKKPAKAEPAQPSVQKRAAAAKKPAKAEPAQPSVQKRAAAAKKPAKPVHGSLSGAIWQARDILRRAGITGLEAFNCVTALLVLRELERVFGLADASQFEVDPAVDPEGAEALETGRQCFSGLAAAPYDADENGDHSERVRTAYDLLRCHATARSATQAFARPEQLYPLRDSRVSYDLVRHVRNKIVPAEGGDTLGDAYMSVTKDFLAGRDLGQFFTPAPVVAFAVEMAMRADPAEAASRRPLGRLLDPTCGSGGFLVAALRRERDDPRAVGREATTVAGIEIDPCVQPVAYANCLLQAGRPFEGVRQGDFFREPLPPGFDTLLANPPFGLTVKHAEAVAVCPDGAASFPLKSAATGLFLQRIVRALAVGGRGVVVLPLGRELDGRGEADVKLRRALSRALAIRMVVLVPAGTFTTTGIRTVVIVFDKVAELGASLVSAGRDAVQVDGALADEWGFSVLQLRTDAAGKVLPETEPVPGVQPRVTAAQFEARNCSLSPNDYRLAAVPNTAAPSGYSMVRLGDLCSLKAGASITKAALNPGTYPVVGGGMEPLGAHDRHNTAAGTILIAKDGNVGHVSRYATPIFLTGHGYAVSWAGDRVFPAFGWHLLKLLGEPAFRGMRKGACQPALQRDAFDDHEVPLPPLDVQRAIAAELDWQAEGIVVLETSAARLEHLKAVVLDNALFARGHIGRAMGCGAPAPGVEWVRLGALFAVKKGKVQASKTIPGDYPVISIGLGKTHNEQTDDGEVLVVTTVFSGGFGSVGARVHYHRGPCAVTSLMGRLVPKEGSAVDLRFAYYALKRALPEINAGCEKGLANKTLDLMKFAELEVPLPPLDAQQAIAAELDQLTASIASLRRSVESARAASRATLDAALRSGAPAIDADGSAVKGSGVPAGKEEACFAEDPEGDASSSSLDTEAGDEALAEFTSEGA